MSQIVPDGKDWTIVLDTVCEQCGYDVRGISPGDAIEQLPGHVERYISVLSRPDAAIRTNPARWSEQEYVALSWILVSINAFNRVAIAGRYSVPPRDDLAGEDRDAASGAAW